MQNVGRWTESYFQKSENPHSTQKIILEWQVSVFLEKDAQFFFSGGKRGFFGQKQADEINTRLQNVLINSYLHLRRRSSHTKMSPLHLEHLLGFKLLCLAMRASSSSATDSAVPVARSQFWPSHYHLPPTRKPWQQAHGSWNIMALGLCRQGSSWGPRLDPAWLGHRPGPFLPQPPSWCLLKSGQVTEAHGLSTRRHIRTAAYRCNAKGTHLWLMTAASVTALHCCAHLPGLTASLTTTQGWEGAGEVSWVEEMCSQSFSLLPIHLFTCKTNN